MTQPSFRDIEMLTAYLDGQLDTARVRRLESRMESDPALRAAFNAMRESRTLLRRVPRRRAPRNFTLTPQMIGVRPPLPRTYSAFRFASALAAFLFVFAMVTNFVVPRAIPQQQMLAAAPLGRGGGGAPEENPRPQSGGGCGDGCAPAATEAPAAPAAPAPTEAPAATVVSAPQMSNAMPTATSSATEKLAPQPTTAAAEIAPQAAAPPQQPPADQFVRPVPAVAPQPPVPALWVYALLTLAVLCGGIAFFVRWQTDRAFKKRQK